MDRLRQLPAIVRSTIIAKRAKCNPRKRLQPSVVPRQNGMLDVAGDLTVHCATKHITIPVRFLGTKQMQGWGDFIGFDTEFTIDRTEFGVNGGSSWSAILGKEVEIHLSVGAFREGDK